MNAIKSDVDLRGMQTILSVGLLVVSSCYAKMGYDFTVTAVTDGQHMVGSLHYKGLAFDCRTRDLKAEDIPALYALCKEALGPQWDVVREGDHMHVEYDPKIPFVSKEA